MKTKNIKINIPEGYNDIRFNDKTNEIEFVKKDSKPRSWEECLKQVCNTPCYAINILSEEGRVIERNRGGFPHVNEFNTEEEAKAFIALGKLIQLRDAWWGDWKPDWEDKQSKYSIYFYKDKLAIYTSYNSGRVLTFPTEEMRDDFLETFRDLIEEAKVLL